MPAALARKQAGSEESVSNHGEIKVYFRWCRWHLFVAASERVPAIGRELLRLHDDYG